MALKLFKKFKKKKLVDTDQIYEGRTLPELNVSPTSSGQYVSGYDENGNRQYTSDYTQSMGYNPDSLPEDPVKKKRRRWSFKRVSANGQQYPGIHGDAEALSKAAQFGIGTAMLATNPITGKMAGDMLTDWYFHPIGNAVGFMGGVYGAGIDKFSGLTKKINTKLPDKIQLPVGTIGGLVGGTLGYGHGRAWDYLREGTADTFEPYQYALASDVAKRPFSALKALFTGRYNLGKRSIRRNLKRLQKNALQGMESTDKEYSKLVGYSRIPPEKNFKFDSDAWSETDYNGDMQLRALSHYTGGSGRNTNIFESSDFMRQVAGHERTHSIQRFLERFTSKEGLKIYSPKTGYHVSNPSHPVAQKYKGYFDLANCAHGMSPEETLANYYGYKARRGFLWKLFHKFPKYNSKLEGLPYSPRITNDFIDDYQVHLTNYNPQAYIINP